MRTMLLRLCLLVCCFGFHSFSWASSDPFEVPLESLPKINPENVVRFRVGSIRPSNPGQHDSYLMSLEMTTRAGFKIYRSTLSFRFLDELGLSASLDYRGDREPSKFFDSFSGKERDAWMSGTSFIWEYKGNLRPTDKFYLRFESCSLKLCLLPAYFVFEASAGVLAKPIDGMETPYRDLLNALPTLNPTSIVVPTAIPIVTPVVVPTATFTEQATAWVRHGLEQRSILLFPALFFAGLLMNLAPCVYPMIPITINVLGRMGGAGASRRRRLSFAALYVLGMAITYATVGLFAALTGGIFGSVLQSTGFVIFISVVMVLLGMMMLGLGNWSGLQNLANRVPVSRSHPGFGVFTMGAVSGLVAAPCTGPVLSMLLIVAAQTRDPIFGFVIMFLFALGFGFPYLILGFFSQSVLRLPKGTFVDAVKYLFAALIFALSLYFLRPLAEFSRLMRYGFLTPPTWLLVCITLIFTLALLTFALKKINLLAKTSLVASGTVLAFWMSLWLTHGFVMPASIALVPVGCENLGNAQEIIWHTNIAKAEQCSTLLQRPMVVDLWASWCTACREMDEGLWKSKEVTGLIRQKYIAVKIDFTNSEAYQNQLAKSWGISGLPAVGIFRPGASILSKPVRVWESVPETADFVKTIDEMAQ